MLNNETFKKLSLVTFFIYILYIALGSKFYDSFKINDKKELEQRSVMLDVIIKKYNISEADCEKIISIINPKLIKKMKMDRKSLEEWEVNVCMCKVISAVIAILLQSLIIWLMYNAAWISFIFAIIRRLIHWKNTVLVSTRKEIQNFINSKYEPNY